MAVKNFKVSPKKRLDHSYDESFTVLPKRGSDLFLMMATLGFRDSQSKGSDPFYTMAA